MSKVWCKIGALRKRVDRIGVFTVHVYLKLGVARSSLKSVEIFSIAVQFDFFELVFRFYLYVTFFRLKSKEG